MFYFPGTRTPDFKNIRSLDYDAYWQGRGYTMRGKLMAREKIFLDWINPASCVLDVGVGNSRLLWELKQFKCCQVSGFDVSPLVIEGLKKKDIDVSTVDIEDKDFALTRRYDYVIMSELLEHIKEPEVLVKKIAASARYLVVSVPNSAYYRYRLGLMFKGRFFTQWRYHPSEHLRYWSHKDFLDWLRALDMEIVQYRASNGFQGKDLWPNMLGHQMCYLARAADSGQASPPPTR